MEEQSEDKYGTQQENMGRSYFLMPCATAQDQKVHAETFVSHDHDTCKYQHNQSLLDYVYNVEQYK